jgi:hypothetical protein
VTRDALPPHLERLDDLPALRLAKGSQDVTGWQVAGPDGRPIGRVTHLLADPDRLVVEHVIVSEAAGPPSRSPGDSRETVVALASLVTVPHERRLEPGAGMEPIRLRYQSTAPLVWWAAAAVVGGFALAWAFGWLP